MVRDFARSKPRQHELELAAKRASDDLIRYKDEEIERLKDMKVRLLPRWWRVARAALRTEFNRLRMTAFPNAYFEKDNDASEVPRATYHECDAAVTRSFRLCSR
ncbi:MAG: hypothetical protein ACLU0O_03205 [Collinsella sp.]